MDVETEKVPDTLAAGIKATGGQGEERGGERGEERGLPSDPGGGRALGPPLGGPAAETIERLRAERDALIRAILIENPPGRFTIGLGDKVSVMPCGRYEAVALVRQVACIGDGTGEPVADRADAHLWAANERLEAERDKLRAERDALLNLIVQPWARDGDGGGDGNSTQLWKVNLAWWETATSREEGVAMVRKAAGLEAKP